jgi:hypothetical protein
VVLSVARLGAALTCAEARDCLFCAATSGGPGRFGGCKGPEVCPDVAETIVFLLSAAKKGHSCHGANAMLNDHSADQLSTGIRALRSPTVMAIAFPEGGMVPALDAAPMSTRIGKRGVIVCVLVAGCGGEGSITNVNLEGTLQADPGDPGNGDELRPPGEPGSGQPRVQAVFSESDELIRNPERGFYANLDLVARPQHAAALRDAGYTLALAIICLENYRYSAIDDGFLAAVDRGFATVRSAGIKVIVRVAYNRDGGQDAPLDRVLDHLDQLAPILERNTDAIAAVQAGLIGAWGEWHASTHNLDTTSARQRILSALLDAVPATRTVQIRTPMFKEEALPGGPLADDEAFTATARARVGHHNDCFLASSSDLGTYASPVDQWRVYVAADTQYVPMGGETCGVNAPRSECEAALAELAALHWSYLNSGYHGGVLDRWAADGCYDEIDRRLGYRLVAESIEYPPQVEPGTALAGQLIVHNRGFAAPYNPRPVYVVVSGQGRRLVTPVAADPRRWMPGQSQVVTFSMQLPADVAAGTYTISLWLPDADPGLAEDARYSIRLANDGLWDPGSGENRLASVTVGAGTPVAAMVPGGELMGL